MVLFLIIELCHFCLCGYFYAIFFIIAKKHGTNSVPQVGAAVINFVINR